MPVRIYPYETLAGDVNLTIDDVQIDHAPPGVDPVVPDVRTIDLSVLEQTDWRVVTLQLDVHGPATELQRRGDEVVATAEAFCRSTNMRQTLSLEKSELDLARWTGTIELDRFNYSGKVDLSVTLAGAVDGVGNRYLAESETWSVYFDEPPLPVIEGTLRIQWLDFGTDEGKAIVGEQNIDEPYYPDLDAAVPILNMNKGFEGLPALLDDRRRTDAAEVAAHELERIAIGADVWGALFNCSAVAVEKVDDEEPTWPSTAWQAGVLRTLLPKMYEMSLEAGLRQLVEDRASPGAARGLQVRAEMAVLKHLRAGRSLRTAILKLDSREGGL